MDEVTAEEGLARTDPRFWEEALGGRGHATWLLTDPEVDAAIRHGRWHALHDVLRRRRTHAPSVAAREALEAVLANRRLFLEPIRGAPGLSTLNGVGTRVYGSQDRNPRDGTYITTRFVVLLFLPLWPLAQYLVAKAPGGGWYFLGRVPLSSVHHWWRRAAFVGLAAAVAGIVSSVWHASTHSDVQFLNGLPVPVAVTMGDMTVEVAPGGRETREVAEGPWHVTARRTDGRVIEERDVEVPGGADLVAYSVLGAAPLVLETVPYTAEGVDPSRGDELAETESLAGDSWVVRNRVHFLFREAPGQISMEKGERVVTRRRVALYEGDWRTTLFHLEFEERHEPAAALARAVARALPGNEDALGLAVVHSEQAGDLEATLAFLEEELQARPDEVQLHRHYQEAMRRLGREDEIVGRYRAAFEADPDSARAGYLYGRLLAHDDARPIYEALVPQHPDDAWLRRGLGWVYHQAGRFADALPHHEKLMELRPHEAGHFVSLVALELAATGRVRDALEEVGKVLDAAPVRTARGEDPLAGSDAWTLIGLHERLRRLLPDATGIPGAEDRWRPFLDGTAPTRELLAETAAHARDADAFPPQRRSEVEPDVRRHCELTFLSKANLDAAASLALETEEDLLLRLADEVQIAIACELERTGHAAEAARLLEGLTPTASTLVGMDAVRALPDVEGLSEDLDPLLRAALLVGAARRVDDAARREALLAEARKLDVLRIVVPE